MDPRGMSSSEAQAIEQEHRSAMRDYLSLLDEYKHLSKSNAVTSARSSVEQKLIEQKTALTQTQEKRENTLKYRMPRAHIGKEGKAYENSQLLGMLRIYRQDLTVVSSGCGVYKFDAPLVEEGQSLQRMIIRLEERLRSNGATIPSEPAPDDPAAKITAAWQAKKNAVIRLERERDEELKTSPESMHKTIKRVYGKAIDAIMEGDE